MLFFGKKIADSLHCVKEDKANPLEPEIP